jgi:hypothetical protein
MHSAHQLYWGQRWRKNCVETYRNSAKGSLMMQGVLVTGADTGVGNTSIETILGHLLTPRGTHVRSRKLL